MSRGLILCDVHIRIEFELFEPFEYRLKQILGSGESLGDTAAYRSKEELEGYKKKDCLLQFEMRVRAEGWLAQDVLDDIKKQSIQLVDEAVAFAEESPNPKLKEIVNDVYATY